MADAWKFGPVVLEGGTDKPVAEEHELQVPGLDREVLCTTLEQTEGVCRELPQTEHLQEIRRCLHEGFLLGFLKQVKLLPLQPPPHFADIRVSASKATVSETVDLDREGWRERWRSLPGDRPNWMKWTESIVVSVPNLEKIRGRHFIVDWMEGFRGGVHRPFLLAAEEGALVSVVSRPRKPPDARLGSPPTLNKAQGDLLLELLSEARDHIYRAAQELGPEDPSRDSLWKLAGEVDDLKVALLRRCKECGR